MRANLHTFKLLTIKMDTPGKKASHLDTKGGINWGAGNAELGRERKCLRINVIQIKFPDMVMCVSLPARPGHLDHRG